MDERIEISKGIDWILVWLYLILITIGVLSIYSVEYKEGMNFFGGIGHLDKNYARQILFAGFAGIIAILILLTDSKFFTATANLGYLFGILLILSTFVVGSDVKGSRSWISLGFINIQPVELCKIFTALALSKYLSRPETKFDKPSSQLIAAGIVLLPAILSILQNETGLALVYFAFVIPMYREGLPGVYLIVGIALGVLVVATILVDKNVLAIILTAIALIAIYIERRIIRRKKEVLIIIIGLWAMSVGVQRFAVPYIFSKVLHPYQVERIMTTFGVDYDPTSSSDKLTDQDLEEMRKNQKESAANYNVKQSKIAIGSGGFWGRGFLNGTQTQGSFVPEQHTDFIYTSVGENFGFWGSSAVVLLYLGLILRLLYLAERQRSDFSRIYAYSVAGILLFHVTVNVCMTVGLAPVIGITLPLMSYGGSSLITFTVLLFIMIRFDADRQMILR